MKRPEDIPLPELELALEQLLALCELDLTDWQRSVLSVHLTHGTLAFRLQGRSPRGKLLPGVTVRRAHRLVPELPED